MTKRTTRKIGEQHNTSPKDWRPIFLETLADTGLVNLSCRAANISKNTAYVHRRDDPTFAAKWDEAKRVAFYGLEDEAWRRARDGVAKPVYYQGELVGEEQQYSDTLLMFLMKAEQPEKFREQLNVKVTVQDLELLKEVGTTPSESFQTLIEFAAAAKAQGITNAIEYLRSLTSELQDGE